MKEWKDMTIEERKVDVRKSGLFYYACSMHGDKPPSPELVRQIIEKNFDQIVADYKEE